MNSYLLVLKAASTLRACVVPRSPEFTTLVFVEIMQLSPIAGK
jgi:hypothetical protein